ncbi:dienelactone hydrolase family protein [Spirochaeta cellobiosiphila]|uniref:dienelactone hydrolase family protein n=1 Tax=Spirochaeta cellobiosiphila TaxID=504483 RepID=UPI0003FB905B|nr:alpha/beta hydrolase family protein [Spirochaeta cellobiosiphila]
MYTQDYEKEALTGSDNTLPVFYESLKAKIPFTMTWTGEGQEFNQWKTEGLQKAEELILPWDDNTPFEMEVIDQIDRGAYMAQKVVFNLTEESRVMALLLIPKGSAPFPAALMLHDHGAKYDIGKEKMVETWKDPVKQASSKAWSQKYFTGTFPGDELAKRGYVVLSCDALGWGDRSVEGWNTEAQQSLASNMFNMGVSYAGWIALEDCRAAQFLASLKQVNKEKVAAVGFSMGAFRAWQVASLSPDIKAGIVENWMATMKGLMVPGSNQLKGSSAYTMLHPFIGKYLDYPDVAGLAAPKPMLFYAGEEDGLFPPSSAKEAFDKMHKIWNASGAGNNLETRFWPYGHVFYKEQQDAAYDWLDKKFAY